MDDENLSSAKRQLEDEEDGSDSRDAKKAKDHHVSISDDPKPTEYRGASNGQKSDDDDAESSKASGDEDESSKIEALKTPILDRLVSSEKAALPFTPLGEKLPENRAYRLNHFCKFALVEWD